MPMMMMIIPSPVLFWEVVDAAANLVSVLVAAECTDAAVMCPVAVATPVLVEGGDGRQLASD